MMPPTLKITPTESFVDEALEITVEQCEPHEELTIHAKTFDDDGSLFESYGVFVADSRGEIDLSTIAPVQGTYDGIDVTGLLWSLNRSDIRYSDCFYKSTATFLKIEFNVERNKKKLDTIVIHRKFHDENVKRKIVDQSGLTGVLFYPDTAHPYPGVLLLSGSEGATQEHVAALLATKGYSVLTLAYFGAEGVSKHLENIPLEYFEKATDWLKEQPCVDQTVSLIGFSRGGELALLLGSSSNQFHSIIVGSPCIFVTSGLRNTLYTPAPAWTKNGKPLSYITFNHTSRNVVSMGKKWLLRRPISFLETWNNSLKEGSFTKEAQIDVEQINAPLMLIAGEEDQCWPSADYTRHIQKKLHSKKRLNCYLSYQDVGHFPSPQSVLPGIPVSTQKATGGGMILDLGGSKKAKAEAASLIWPQLLTFLNKHTK